MAPEVAPAEEKDPFKDGDEREDEFSEKKKIQPTVRAHKRYVTMPPPRRLEFSFTMVRKQYGTLSANTFLCWFYWP